MGKYLAQNKSFAVSKSAKSQTAWSQVLQKELGGRQIALCKWAADLVQSGWTVHDEFKRLLGSGPEDEMNVWLTSPLQKIQHQGPDSLMDHLVACGESKM